MMNLRQRKYILAAIDLTLVYISFVAASLLHQAFMGAGLNLSAATLNRQFFFFILYGVFSIFLFRYYDLYKNSVFSTTLRQVILIIKSMLIFVIWIAVLSFIFKNAVTPGSRLTVFFFLAISTATLSAWRTCILRPAYRRFKSLRKRRIKSVVIGSEPSMEELSGRLSSSAFTLCDFISTGPEENDCATATSGRFLKKISDSIARNQPNAVIIAYGGPSYEDLFEMLDVCRKLHPKVYVFSKLLSVIPEYVVMEDYCDFSLVDMSPEVSTRLPQWFKSLIDRFLSLAAVVVLSPAFLFLAAAVKLTSPGPVFYKQTRIGKKGRPFTFYKFRSMQVGSDNDSWRISKTIESIKSGTGSEGSTKVVNHSRVTPVGRFMRKTSLDEFPQLFNVLKGEMSLVGPRPPLPYELENYSRWHKRRLDSIPGCTGLWQVTARSKVGFNDIVLLDLYYLYNRNFWMDIKILLQTFGVVAMAKGGE